MTALAPWNGGFLAGTKSHGIWQFDASGRIIGKWTRDRTEPNSLISDRIRCMLVDEQDRLWVGTERGLSYHDPQAWTASIFDLYNDDLRTRPEATIFGLAEDKGTLRIFTSEGLFETAAHDPGTIRHIPIIENGVSLAPTCNALSPKGEYFLGTETGLVVYDPVKGKVVERIPFYREIDKRPRPIGMH